MGDSVQVVTTPVKLSVSVVETEAEFKGLEPVWNKLLWTGPRPVPFLTWEWVSTWWKHFHGNSRLFVLVARDDNGVVVGLAPLKVAVRRGFGLVPVRTVEFLGYRGSAVCADHLDFLASPDDRQSVVDRLTQEILARREEWDAIVLADLAEDSPIPEALARRSADEDFSFAQAAGNVCPYVRLNRDWEGFLKAMKKKRRSFVKCRRERLASSYAVRFECDGSADHVHQHLDTLARLHGDSRRRKGERGNFHHQHYRSFHHEVAERMAAAGYLYLARLDCDNRTLAMAYGFRVGDVLFDYQKGYDTAFAHLGVGSVLQGMIVQDAIERLHATEIDFLQGSEAYKYFWTERERHTCVALVWRKKFAGRASEAEFLLRRRLSPWKQRVQILWDSVGQRWRSMNENRRGATPEDGKE
jgi:CelD/BcsL family acetyltransferase involved in cellulose biosynthesis